MTSQVVARLRDSSDTGAMTGVITRYVEAWQAEDLGTVVKSAAALILPGTQNSWNTCSGMHVYSAIAAACEAVSQAEIGFGSGSQQCCELLDFCNAQSGDFGRPPRRFALQM